MHNLENRFGEVAIQMGFIELGQLQESLAVQAEENVTKGSHRLIGVILQDLGYLDSDQTSKVLINLKVD